MQKFHCAGALLVCLVGVTSSAHSGWNSAPDTQYHIQTDEGPERYFRYQTQSGQYRKEKRLQDGTVVGSYGWIDADGYLRLRDYIADDQGYRILKSKTVFVGQERPIKDAISVSKHVPAQSGILVKPGTTQSKVAAKVPSTVLSPTRGSFAPVNAVTPAPTLYSYLPPSSTPRVSLSHNSIESSTEKPRFDFRPTIAPIAVTSTTQRPISYTTPVYSTSTESPSSSYLPSYESSTPTFYEVSSTPEPIIAITSNSLGEFRKKYQPAFGERTHQVYYPSADYGNQNSGYSTNSLNLDPFGVQSTPIDRADEYRYNSRYQTPKVSNDYRGNPAVLTGNQLGNGYDPQYPLYDGVAVTNNGFRYYLPRQYHEEENSGSETRAGSFGYVDPFGIRRVVYYNTSPGSGFVHRKNNRYVGLNATPYDPRPV